MKLHLSWWKSTIHLWRDIEWCILWIRGVLDCIFFWDHADNRVIVNEKRFKSSIRNTSILVATTYMPHRVQDSLFLIEIISRYGKESFIMRSYHLNFFLSGYVKSQVYKIIRPEQSITLNKTSNALWLNISSVIHGKVSRQ